MYTVTVTKASHTIAEYIFKYDNYDNAKNQYDKYKNAHYDVVLAKVEEKYEHQWEFENNMKIARY